ncbi:ABC transporter ATP-binding protein [Marivita sp. S2033]|uniref:ABC transporter ATP-binding protein n=1 Tax=Marivita sp. S2033 TaxID=3373187 RepID=UPI0039824343
MTAMTVYLEDFGTSTNPGSMETYSDEMLETERLESFDKGYRAGWDDAIKAKSDDAEQLSVAFSQNLQDLSFTYHDVHAQVLSNLTPLFDEIMRKMLPALAKDTLGAHICDKLTSLAKETGTTTISIVVSPGSGEQVSKLLSDWAGGLPVTVTESTNVAEGQAEIHLGEKELSIDLAGAVREITQAVSSVIHKETEVRSHG